MPHFDKKTLIHSFKMDLTRHTPSRRSRSIMHHDISSNILSKQLESHHTSPSRSGLTLLHNSFTMPSRTLFFKKLPKLLFAAFFNSTKSASLFQTTTWVILCSFLPSVCYTLRTLSLHANFFLSLLVSSIQTYYNGAMVWITFMYSVSLIVSLY